MAKIDYWFEGGGGWNIPHNYYLGGLTSGSNSDFNNSKKNITIDSVKITFTPYVINDSTTKLTAELFRPDYSGSVILQSSISLGTVGKTTEATVSNHTYDDYKGIKTGAYIRLTQSKATNTQTTGNVHLIINYTVSDPYTNCTSPSKLYCTSTFGTIQNVNVAWEGAANGTNTSVIGYYYKYLCSDDNIQPAENDVRWSADQDPINTTELNGNTNIYVPDLLLGQYCYFKFKSISSVSGYDALTTTISTNSYQYRAQVTTPTDLTISNATPPLNTSVHISWAPSTTTATLTGYRVYVYTETETTPVLLAEVSTEYYDAPILLDDYTAGETYYFKVRAVAHSQAEDKELFEWESSLSEAVSIVPNPEVAPDPPINVKTTSKVIPVGQSTNLTWQAPADMESTSHFTIMVSNDGRQYQAYTGGENLAYNVNSFKVKAADTACVLYFIVRVVKQSGIYNDSLPAALHCVTYIALTHGVGRTNATIRGGALNA